MSDNDWFRKSNWAQEDQDDFYAHLKECEKPFHKAQYLRIQALHLQDAGTAPMLDSAIELINLLIEEAPEPSQLAMAYLQKAECLDGLGRVEEALKAYRDSLDAQRAFPKAKTAASISFGMFVVGRGLTDLYDEVLGVLDEFPDSATLPEQEYLYYAVKALIAGYQGDPDKAREYARGAIDAAQQTYSGSHYDRSYLGLVEKPDFGLHERISKLAGF